MNAHTTSTNTNTTGQLATAPEIPSSMNYYDPRGYSNSPNNYNNYMSPNTATNTPNFVNQPPQPPNNTVTATTTTPTTATANYMQPSNTNANYTTPPNYHYNTNHLPPLSHLLPTNKNDQQTSSVQENYAHSNSRKNSTIDTMYSHSQHQNYYYVPIQQPSNSHLQPPPSSVPSQNDLAFHPPLPPNMYTTRNGQIYHLPSPPTSVIDGVLITDPSQFHPSHYHPYVHVPSSSNQKVFSFVPLPGLNQKKRPRRKFHEVERLYQCNYQDCTKAYGTLNHLNAHVSMQRHGPKRQPSEFKELRKMWRKQKRENKQRQLKQEQEQQQETENMNDMLPSQEYPIYHPTPWNNRYEFMPPPPPY